MILACLEVELEERAGSPEEKPRRHVPTSSQIQLPLHTGNQPLLLTETGLHVMDVKATSRAQLLVPGSSEARRETWIEQCEEELWESRGLWTLDISDSEDRQAR